jgi:hypothetical protein
MPKETVKKGPRRQKLKLRQTEYKHRVLTPADEEDMSPEDRQRCETALELRIKGCSYQEIAKAIGRSKGTVGEILTVARKSVSRRYDELAEEELFLCLERINLIIGRHLPIATAPQYKLLRHDPTGELLMDEDAVKEQQKSAELVLKCEMFRATLLGYAKPKQQDQGTADINAITAFLASKAAEMIHRIATQDEVPEPTPIDTRKVKLVSE